MALKKKKLARKAVHYEPAKGFCPHIDNTESPHEDFIGPLLHAAQLGMSIEIASAYAEIPSPLVRNWLCRGREQELSPFDENKYEDIVIRKKQIKYFNEVTVKCFNFWMQWRKSRALFVMNTVGKIHKSKDWKSKAWLLERLEPGIFVRPDAPKAVKRDLLPNETEGEGDTLKLIQAEPVLVLPSNGRGDL